MLEGILEYYDEETFLKMDGFDNAVIGIDERTMRLIYSERICIEILMQEQDMSIEDAIEYFEFNTKGAYFGEKTPIICSDTCEF